MPTEGTKAGSERAGTVARRDVPTCNMHEDLGPVSERVRRAGWDACVVVNDERVVMGLLRAEHLDGDGTRSIEVSMRPGPSTFRPNVPIAEMAEYMAAHHLESSPVTTSDGRLVGLLRRHDAERVARQRESADDRPSSE